MKTIINIIENLMLLSGKAQLSYLEENKDNELLREILYYTLNPNLIYNISEVSFNKSFERLGLNIPKEDLTGLNNDLNIFSWNIFKSHLDILSNKKGVKDNEIDAIISEFWGYYSHEQLELYKGVLLKDLKLGMGISTCNKVLKDFVYKFSYMGAKSFNDKNLSKITYPCIGQIKCDGLYCNMIVKNNKVSYISRQGKKLSLDGIFDEYLNKDHDYVLNGEILVLNENKNKYLPREVSNGIIKRDDKTDDEKSRIRFVCWDYIPYDCFVDGIYSEGTVFRLNKLKDIVSMHPLIKIVDTFEIESKEHAMQKFEEAYSQGEEGIIVKNLTQIWKDGKPSGQVKIKSEKDCDLQMVDFIEGKGAYQGMCGSIRCISSDDKLEVFVKPRTPDDANYIWNNKEACLGKVLAVKYNDKIKSPTKELWSLYLPVFIEIRDDKDIADKLEEIK